MNYDLVIVGSGVAATALVFRLLEQDPKASILLLEAGERVKTKDFALWQEYVLTRRAPYVNNEDKPYPQRDEPGENAHAGDIEMPLQGARLFNYGGSTMHWGGWSLRLKPEDFALETNTEEGADWPYPYEVLEPYYCQAEAHLAVSGDSQDGSVPRSGPFPFRHFPYTLQDKPLADALDGLGYAHGAMPIARRGHSKIPSRHAPCQTTGTCKYCPFGARYVASNYLDDLRTWNDHPGLEVVTGAVVETIETAGRNRAVSVTYRDRATGEERVVGAGRIVIAAGAIESAKLLQRSRSPAWPEGIGNDTGHVGANIITHPFLTFKARARGGNPLRLQPEMDFPTLISRHFDSEAEQKAGKFVIINPVDTMAVNLAREMQAGKSRQQVDDIVKDHSILQLNVMVEVFGEITNRIDNMDERNRFGLRQTRVFYANPDFAARRAQVSETMKQIFAAMGADLETGVTTSWRADHAGSTCRMSVSAGDGVVDEHLRVHGMENLWVCSNAVFPALGAINPTLTLTALALKLGDHLNAGGRP